MRWRHAWAGAIFVAVAFEGAKELLAWYLQSVPIVTTVYGAFATVPILLLWIYLGWLIVLFGAVIAAYAPSLTMRIARRSAAPGHRFELALALLRELDRARAGGVHGASLEALAAALRTDPLQVEPVLDRLVELDLVARLDEAGEQRLVLLGEPWRTPAAPLVDALLLAPAEGTRLFRERAGFARLTLSDLLGTAG